MSELDELEQKIAEQIRKASKNVSKLKPTDASKIKVAIDKQLKMIDRNLNTYSLQLINIEDE